MLKLYAYESEHKELNQWKKYHKYEKKNIYVNKEKSAVLNWWFEGLYWNNWTL